MSWSFHLIVWSVSAFGTVSVFLILMKTFYHCMASFSCHFKPFIPITPVSPLPGVSGIYLKIVAILLINKTFSGHCCCPPIALPYPPFPLWVPLSLLPSPITARWPPPLIFFFLLSTYKLLKISSSNLGGGNLLTTTKSFTIDAVGSQASIQLLALPVHPPETRHCCCSVLQFICDFNHNIYC